MGKEIFRRSIRSAVGPNGSGLLTKRFVYDFAVNGGSHTTTNVLRDGLPSGAVITRLYSRTITAVLSNGSATLTVAIGVYNALFTAIAKASWSVDSIKSLTLLNNPSIISTSEDGSDLPFSVTIGVADLTAGKIEFFVEYFVTTPPAANNA